MNSNKTENFDLIVLGAGSGGVRASRIAASFGAKVAIIEADRFGGTCVIRGCIPKKLLVYASSFASDFSSSIEYGWKFKEVSHDWKKLIKNKDKEINRLEEIYNTLLKNAGVKIFRGTGSFINKNTILINGQQIMGEKILIATGGVPRTLDINGLKENSITSNEAFELEKLPKTIVIHGSGYIALEFAGIFNSLGSKVHLIFRSELPLRGFDKDIRENIEKIMLERGIKIHSLENIKKIEKNKIGFEICLSSGKKIVCDKIMSATGRKPNVKKLNLEKVGVQLDENQAIIVNKSYKTNVNNIFAIGDVTNRMNLTPVAIEEGQIFAEKQFNNKKRILNYENIPTAVFSQPPIAFVGLNEETANKKFKKIDVFTTSFNPLKNTISGKNEKTLMKMIVCSTTEKILGIHMLGPDAPEIIQGLAIPVNLGAKKSDFDNVMAIHPTSAEEFVLMKTKRK